MEEKSRTLLQPQPALHLSALVSAVVIHDQVHLLIGGYIPFQMDKEADELAVAMAVLADADNLCH